MLIASIILFFIKRYKRGKAKAGLSAGATS